MFNKLAQVKAHYLDLQKQLEDGSVYADPALAAKLLGGSKGQLPDFLGGLLTIGSIGGIAKI